MGTAGHGPRLCGSSVGAGVRCPGLTPSSWRVRLLAGHPDNTCWPPTPRTQAHGGREREDPRPAACHPHSSTCHFSACISAVVAGTRALEQPPGQTRLPACWLCDLRRVAQPL